MAVSLKSIVYFLLENEGRHANSLVFPILSRGDVDKIYTVINFLRKDFYIKGEVLSEISNFFDRAEKVIELLYREDKDGIYIEDFKKLRRSIDEENTLMSLTVGLENLISENKIHLVIHSHEHFEMPSTSDITYFKRFWNVIFGIYVISKRKLIIYLRCKPIKEISLEDKQRGYVMMKNLVNLK